MEGCLGIKFLPNIPSLNFVSVLAETAGQIGPAYLADQKCLTFFPKAISSKLFQSNYKNADKRIRSKKNLPICGSPQRPFREPLKSEMLRRQEVSHVHGNSLGSNEPALQGIKYYANKFWRQKMRWSFLKGQKYSVWPRRSLAQNIR